MHGSKAHCRMQPGQEPEFKDGEFMGREQDYREAEREREAREQGRTIRHYARKVVKKITGPVRRGRSTPPKTAKGN